MASNKPFDVFLSYNQASAQPAIKDLYQKLKDKYGDAISIWVDYEQWAKNPGLGKYTVLMQGLEDSKLILCCLTSGYSKSKDCQKELSYAMDVHKGQYAILMLDHYNDLADKGVKLQIINEARLNFYNNKVAICIENAPHEQNTEIKDSPDEPNEHTMSRTKTIQTIVRIASVRIREIPQVDCSCPLLSHHQAFLVLI
jgi:hypothetical protein